MSADDGRDTRGVVNDVGEGFGCDHDVVPAVAWCIRRGCRVFDGGVDGMRDEGVGSEVAGLDGYARAGDRGVVGAADEGDIDILQGLESCELPWLRRKMGKLAGRT